MGILGSIRWYNAAAIFQFLMALHTDFVIPSYLGRDQVIWILLGIWLIALWSIPLWKQCDSMERIGPWLSIWFLGCMAHVFYHHPYSLTGLWATVTIAILGALTPRISQQSTTQEQRLAAGLLLLAIPWLTYFSQIRLGYGNRINPFSTWAFFWVSGTILLTGCFAYQWHKKWATLFHEKLPTQPRLYHQTLSLCEEKGGLLFTTTLWVAMVITTFITFSYQIGRFFLSPQEILIGILLWLGIAWAWFIEGRERQSAFGFSAAQASIIFGFILLRRHLLLNTTFWNHEYDVWTSLVVSALLTGYQGFIPENSRSLQRSILSSLFILPLFALGWIYFYHLGTNIALVLVGLHSLMFAFLGKGNRNSPYNLVAMGGFVLFVVILFWSKLELRVLHAYTIPVGMGILTLLHLSGSHIPSDSRQRIQLVTFGTMLGTSAYYALADPRYPMGFHLTLLLLCLTAMGLGSLLQSKVYLYLGFGGLLVTLGSIFYKVIVRLDTTYKMTSIGIFLLVLGVGLVAGSAYYKTNREAIEEKLRNLKNKQSQWN
jgi:hypothetical protein